jgi:hypothetical protein
MTHKYYETIIIGAGISGLACAKTLQQHDKEFSIISENIGGRILTSKDGKVNYGAFFVCSDYYHVLQYVTIHSRIKLRDFCFHDRDKTYILFQLKLLRYIIQFVKIIKLLYTFRKHLRKLRKTSEKKSQKNAIKQDPFLYNLYMEKADEFVKRHKIQKGTEVYLSKALHSTTFSTIYEMNAFSFLQFLLPLITPIYTFKFKTKEMILTFKDKLLITSVDDVSYSKGLYTIKANNDTFQCTNIVLATEISWSKKIAHISQTNKPISTNMLHIKGIAKDVISKKKYHLFSPKSNVQAIAHLPDDTFLFYYKKKPYSLERFFKNPKIIGHHHWDPAGTINGHELIECQRDHNLYLIGDYNICGLEEAFITGILAANQIIKSN